MFLICCFSFFGILAGFAEQQFALKKFDRRVAEKSLIDEVDILSRLRHEHIIRCEFFFEDGRYVYIVMQLATSGDLFQRIQGRRSDGKGSWRAYQVKEWFAQVLSGTGFMHSKKILHRDIKTPNILITKDDDGREKMLLCDFGLAKQSELASQLTQTQVGTRLYQSPEMIQNKPYQKDCDYWALGCVLYEMWYGLEDEKTTQLSMSKMSQEQYEI